MNSDYIHKEYPKTCDPKDFLGQVKRTVNGKPVSQVHIDMIVNAIKKGLHLNKYDILIDIGCGNGALSRYLFDNCSKYLGIDFSEYLIKIAKLNFEKLPLYEFQEIDAASYVESELNPDQYIKALCYGCFSYLSFEDAERVLTVLSKRFSNTKILYIGNLPDKDRAHLFYPKEKDFNNLLDDRNSPIGIWRNQDEMTKLANKTGWSIKFNLMPEEFYASHYRYDAILTPRRSK